MRKIFTCMCLVMLAFLAACSDDEPDAQDNESKENDVEEKEKASESAAEMNTFPLTGVQTDGPVNNRIVSVMVNNHPKARPQSGLSKADIVFEILAEGQITRLLAMYQSELPEVVGPVRSAREYYFDLANSYDSLYIYHGAANFVNEMIKNRGIAHLDGAVYDNDGQLFKRESFRQAPHNSYLQFGTVYDTAEQKGYDITKTYEPLTFAAEEEAADISGDPASTVEIDYSNRLKYTVEYIYDSSSEKYTRYSDGEKTVELNSGEPITTDNILIVETPHQVIDDAGRRSIDLTSGGNAYLVQKGKVREVQWEKRDGRIIPVQDGEPVQLVQGKTWINVVPSNPGISQSVTLSNQ
ncbi:DUF3048 domain-containing protein [Lentibacillus sp. CBA3610]|uniref:DUF3048 domain-containing protein n=1 Tax=Lentibacillus sp. CBA3610 TaxID=2518176 RepID=UPI0015955B10|nr:DUF3048 domain-containing protein [Lentibacillus sp. CBA3610]QKY71475.1 DUF3048 domain-containing protein [Lentibacillus sp. CBA3610]